MNITDVGSHPLMRQILEDVEQGRAQSKLDAELTQLEQSRLRHEQGQYLRKQYERCLADYEAKRAELHEVVGQLWNATQAYSRVVGQLPSGFAENMFNKIDLPSLAPTAKKWDSGFSTTRAAVMAWFASRGQEWK